MEGPTFLFVVDGPDLELQSLLLAASLRRWNPGNRVIAYRPKGADPLLPETRGVFEATGVETCEIARDGRGLWARPYPHGNKILACASPRAGGATVFLDTDMVAARAFDPCCLPGPGEVSVVPEGVPSWGRDGDRWARAYAHFGLPVPEDRVRLTRRKRRDFLPYFNAGFVAFRSEDGFAEAWLETALEIDHGLKIGGKRPWLDQIALPIALRRAGLAYRALEADWNFSVSDRPFEPDARPAMVHYHRFGYLAGWPEGRIAWEALVKVLRPGAVARVADRFEAAGLPVRAFGS